jgi:muconolactone D-isomerase
VQCVFETCRSVICHECCCGNIDAFEVRAESCFGAFINFLLDTARTQVASAIIKLKTMNCIQAILTIDTDNLPPNFQEIIKHEQEVVAQYKAEGILEHLFLRQGRNGAVLIFKDIDEQRAKELMETLPLYKLMKSVEYYSLMKQF